MTTRFPIYAKKTSLLWKGLTNGGPMPQFRVDMWGHIHMSNPIIHDYQNHVMQFFLLEIRGSEMLCGRRPLPSGRTSFACNMSQCCLFHMDVANDVAMFTPLK